MAKKLTVLDFFKRYPDEDTCLDHIMEVRYGKRFECPKCEKESTFYRIKKRPAYACEFCGHHINPMAGTPFENTRTPLQMWFYAIYLFTTTRHGVSAKELQRQLGVTYKTAWRMAKLIREHMGTVDGDGELFGKVEADETYVGGKPRITGQSKPGRGTKKALVFGMVERGGRLMTRMPRNAGASALGREIERGIIPGSHVYTDEYVSYRGLPELGYKHATIEHGSKEWVRGDIHTNTIEGFWSHFKCAVKGTHRAISKKHMMKYLGEFEYRFNRRHLSSDQMLDELLQTF